MSKTLEVVLSPLPVKFYPFKEKKSCVNQKELKDGQRVTG